MQKTNINPEIFQQMLETAPNAGAKGQSQFFTPAEWGQVLALPLPRCRHAAVDLNCGAGHLLQATANKTTQHLLGADIDPCRGAKAAVLAPWAKLSRVTADVTRFYPLLAEVDWRADLWALNPPWDLHFWRANLTALAESDIPAVREAFAVHDGRTAAGTIDSTVAMLLIALDRCSYAGEGLLIGNNATLERLILAPGAPHGALAKHIWARVIIEGNPMTGIRDCSFQDTFRTGVIYFASDHESGCRIAPPIAKNLAETTVICGQVASLRGSKREGASVIDSWQGCRDTVSLWTAVATEWQNQQERTRNDYNLWLSEDGEIRTNLSLFEERSMTTGRSGRILKEQANQLYQLHGKRPMELVLQRSQRELLMRQCQLDSNSALCTLHSALPQFPWRVQPKLKEAVLEAVRQYHSCRAPLYPLPGLQRLGYLEEGDSILCKKDLVRDGTTLYKAGESYALATQSVCVTRRGFRPNLAAEMEEVEYSGSELATYITDATGTQRCFMEGRLREQNVSLDGYPATEKIEFTLQELDEHFIIPDVPDVAVLNPEAFQSHLAQLEQLETFINS
jgi:hypothetical protein